MKKSYFVTWLGALSTLFITYISILVKIKKYGRKIYSTSFIKPSEKSIREMLDKGVDFALNKIVK